MKRKNKPTKPKIAALQKPTAPTPPECTMHLGYEMSVVSRCCGALTRTKTRKGREVTICKGCYYETSTSERITRANLHAAYGRRPVTTQQVLDLFYRGWDFDIEPYNRHTSVRDMAQGAILQIRYGKALHKVMSHIVEHALMVKPS